MTILDEVLHAFTPHVPRVQALNGRGTKRGTVLALVGQVEHLSEPKKVCCRCDEVMNEGSEPITHGLCAECVAVYLGEA